jgi:sortase A
MSVRRLHVLVSLAPLVVGAALLAEQVWLRGKAAVAAMMIDRAFAVHLEDGAPHRPWNWADTHPIARLSVPRLGIRRTVLAGSSGSSLAFGPGHLSGSAAPNLPGNCVLAGHRDSWFAFLRELRVGDEILLRTAEGRRRYRVRALEVRSMRDTTVLAPSATRRLTLVTCFPFGGLRRGELRFVVTCEEDA